jgi:hypothetical protein
VTLLVPRILTWLLDFWKICELLAAGIREKHVGKNIWTVVGERDKMTARENYNLETIKICTIPPNMIRIIKYG